MTVTNANALRPTASTNHCGPAANFPAGGAGDTAQSVVSRSKLILPDTANKEAAAQALVNGVGNNGVIEKRKVGNGFQTLSKSYELGEAMLNDALAGAPESTAGRLQFLADADNNIDMVLTLFYPEDVSEGAMEQDAAQGAALVNQRRESGTYDAAFVSAGQEAGFDGAAVTVESFVVESGAPSLRASLMGMCISVDSVYKPAKFGGPGSCPVAMRPALHIYGQIYNDVDSSTFMLVYNAYLQQSYTILRSRLLPHGKGTCHH
eukprot:247742-Pelagomonas_calceolata.AAC.2